jgi:hypothetical protein
MLKILRFWWRPDLFVVDLDVGHADVVDGVSVLVRFLTLEHVDNGPGDDA